MKQHKDSYQSAHFKGDWWCDESLIVWLSAVKVIVYALPPSNV
jgi:hypothetical protein